MSHFTPSLEQRGKQGRAVCSPDRAGDLATCSYSEPEAHPLFGLMHPHVTAPFLVTATVLPLPSKTLAGSSVMRTKWPWDMLGTDVPHSIRLQWHHVEQSAVAGAFGDFPGVFTNRSPQTSALRALHVPVHGTYVLRLKK